MKKFKDNSYSSVSQEKEIISINGQEFDAAPEKTVLQFLQQMEIAINHSCEGNASCGTCRVFVQSTTLLPKKNTLEREFTDERGFSVNERLSCQMNCVPGLIIQIPED